MKSIQSLKNSLSKYFQNTQTASLSNQISPIEIENNVIIFTARDSESDEISVLNNEKENSIDDNKNSRDANEYEISTEIRSENSSD